MKFIGSDKQGPQLEFKSWLQTTMVIEKRESSALCQMFVH